MPLQPQQSQHDQNLYQPPADSRGSPCEEPSIHPVTDIYGLPPGDPFYRPQLRYTPREPEFEDAQRERAAMSLVDKHFPSRAMDRSAMPPPQSGTGGNDGHTQPVDHGSAAHSRPRPPSSPLMSYRPMDMRRDQGHAGHGSPGPKSISPARPVSGAQIPYATKRLIKKPRPPTTWRQRLRDPHSGHEDLDLWNWSED